jgi:hypothetical protein
MQLFIADCERVSFRAWTLKMWYKHPGPACQAGLREARNIFARILHADRPSSRSWLCHNGADIRCSILCHKSASDYHGYIHQEPALCLHFGKLRCSARCRSSRCCSHQTAEWISFATSFSAPNTDWFTHSPADEGHCDRIQSRAHQSPSRSC